MATKSYSDLLESANKIKENELPESNTHTVVGDQLVQMVAKQEEEYNQRIKGICEYNVSKQFPTEGINGTNKYTLEAAIAKIPAELQSVGLKCSFLDDAGDTESWEYKGGAFTSTASWRECGGRKFTDLDRKNYGDIIRTNTPLSDFVNKYTAFPIGNKVQVPKIAGFYVNAGTGEIIAYKADVNANTCTEIETFSHNIDGVEFHSFSETLTLSDGQYVLLKGKIGYADNGESLYFDGNDIRTSSLEAAIILVSDGITLDFNRRIEESYNMATSNKDKLDSYDKIIEYNGPSTEYSTMTLYNAGWILANKYSTKNISAIELYADVGKKDIYIVDINEGTTSLAFSLYHAINGKSYYRLPYTIRLSDNQYIGIKGVKKNTNSTKKCYIGTTEYVGECSFSVFGESLFTQAYNLGKYNEKRLSRVDGFLSVECGTLKWDGLQETTDRVYPYIPNYSNKNPVGIFYRCLPGSYQIGIVDLGSNSFESRIEKQIADEGTYYEDISSFGELGENQFVAIRGAGLYKSSLQSSENVGYKILYSSSLVGEDFGEIAIAVVGKGLFSNVIKEIENMKNDIANLQSGVGQRLTIFCYGDSLTACRYAMENGEIVIKYDYPYPYWLEKYLKGTIVKNYSQGGINAQGFWNTKIKEVDFSLNPNVIIIMLGTNAGLTGDIETDVNAFDDYNEYADTMIGCYCKIIEYSMKQAPQAQIILCTIPHSTTLDSNASQAYPVILEVAKKYSLPIIDVYNESGISKYTHDCWQPLDGTHFTIDSANKFSTFIGSKLKSILSYVQIVE